MLIHRKVLKKIQISNELNGREKFNSYYHYKFFETVPINFKFGIKQLIRHAAMGEKE